VAANIKVLGYVDQVLTDPTCLLDCFSSDPSDPTFCLYALLKDYVDNGVCRKEEQLNYTTSNNCILNGNDIIKGTCSVATELILAEETCFKAAFEQQLAISNTMFLLLGDMCSDRLVQDLIKAVQGETVFGTNPIRLDFQKDQKPQNRINPLNSLGLNFKTSIPYENVRHRYPWICSLRTHGTDPEHLCTVTILSVPPDPVVIIGPGHCTVICKDRDQKMPSCCCILEGIESCRSDIAKCGENALATQLNPREADIVCGEWESGPVPMNVSNENYNVVLPIKEIVVHEGYDLMKGPINGDDIAVFKVDSEKLEGAASNNIHPACMPGPNRRQPVSGVISGWAPPPPFYVFEKYYPYYVQNYGDLLKQWHYKMEILSKCRDPTYIKVYNRELKYPSNTFYPAGTVCAKEFRRHCFTGGDSGSPLMVKDPERPSRYYVEGTFSFAKACELQKLGTAVSFFGINQENPSVFTNLYCYLPWIAKQFRLTYEYESEVMKDKTCQRSTGSFDNSNKTCRENLGDPFSEEKECIFPFYYNGELQTECALQTIDSAIVVPNFVCPVRNITTKINGINSFNFTANVRGFLEYCLDADGNLDPDEKNCSILEKVPPLVPCKNDCPGGNFF